MIDGAVAANLAFTGALVGSLGAVEAALVSGRSRLAVLAGKAVAAVLAFRLVSFWMPLPIGGLLLRRARKRV